MFRPGLFLAAVLLLIPTVEASAQDGRLQRVRDDANGSSSSSPPSGNSGNSGSGSSGGSDTASSIFNSLFCSDPDGNSGPGILALGLVAIAPFYIPIQLLDDRYQDRLYFAPHPYAGAYRGYQLLDTDLAKDLYDQDTSGVTRKNWAVRLAVEDGTDFNGINRLNGQLRIEHASRFGILSNWNYFHENLTNGKTDETVIGDTNLTFRFAQNEVASLYTGAGFRMLADRHQTNYGFNFTYGGDWFPVRPLIVSSALDLGNLGSAAVVHARGSVGAIYHGLEFYVGYDFLRIGGTNLQGPMAGVRFWF